MADKAGNKNNGFLAAIELKGANAYSLIDFLILSCIKGLSQEVHHLLEFVKEHGDVIYLVNRTNRMGITPVTATLFLGPMLPTDEVTSDMHKAVLEELRSKGANFNAPDGFGMYPIFAALAADFPVALYVFNNAYVKRVEPFSGENLVMKAAANGLDEIIHFIHDEFDMNARDLLGNTALHHAFIRKEIFTRMERSDMLTIVRTLLTYGADPTVANNRGIDSFEVALANNWFDISFEMRRSLLPPNDNRRIQVVKIQGAEPENYFINLQQTIGDFKKALFFENYGDYDLIFPGFRGSAELKKMVDERTFSDYGIVEDSKLVVQPKIYTGWPLGGRRKGTRRTSKRKSSTRRR